MAQRIQIHVGGVTRSYSAPGPIILGRNADVAGVVVTHRAVSGQHAKLTHDGQQWVLSDEGSSNGTWVGGQRLNAPTGISAVTTVRLGKLDDGADVVLDPTTGSGIGDTPPAATGNAGGRTPTPGASHASSHGATARRPEPPAPTPPIQMPPAVSTPPTRQGAAPVGATYLGGPGPARPSGRPLLASLGTRTVTLPATVGRRYTVGRDPSTDVPSHEITVSREHLKLEWSGTGWAMTDVSARGTFREDGSPLTPQVPTPLTDSTTLRLGDAQSGESLALTLSGLATQRDPVAWWRSNVAVLAVVALVLAIGGVLVAVGTRDSGTNVLTAAELATVKKSVVRLTLVGADGKDLGWGSGSIISKDGMILTNAHVANPEAPGLTAQYGLGGVDTTAVDHLVVAITTQPDKPAVDTYLAKPLVTDGYVDLSVVKIYATVGGGDLPSDLNLPFLPIADTSGLSVGDALTVLGFPGASDSDSLTVNPGEISAFVKDPHMHTERAFLETSGEIRHGNSGGAAVDVDGNLVAVPSRSGPSQEKSDRARPVSWAQSLIKIAREGGDPHYVSPFLTELRGDEKATANGLTDKVSSFAHCGDAQSTQLPSGQEVLGTFTVDAAKGVDLYPTIVSLTSDGKFAGLEYSATQQSKGPGTCAIVDASDGLASGSHELLLFAGPDAEKVLASQVFTITG